MLVLNNSCIRHVIRNIEADNANGILKNAAIAVPLKYLSNLWRSLEMPFNLLQSRIKT